MRAAKVDACQPEIVEALRKAGCSVTSMARLGGGVPDLLIGVNGKTAILELKMPGEKLNPLQREWHAAWKGGTLAVVDSVESALRVARLMGNE